MKNVRKLITVSLVLGMLCIFTACGTDKNKNENDMAGNTNTTENGTTNNNAGTGNGTTNGTVGSNTDTDADDMANGGADAE